MAIKSYFIAILLLLPLGLAAQGTSRLLLKKGNKAIERKEYAHAESLFRKALMQDSTEVAARYGLGNALYEQGKYKDALEVYGNIAPESIESQEEASQLFHNIGNAQLKLKQYAPAVESFKQSLRLNPMDDETRYNLALALKQLPKDQPPTPQNNALQPNNSPNNEQQNQQKEQEKSDDAPKNGEKIDPETAKKILDSYKHDEENTRRKYEEMQRSQQEAESSKDEKRW